MNFIINTIPKKPSFKPMPGKSNPVLYGQYLVNAASCIECHSQADKGSLIAGLEFAGGREFPMPTGGVVRSANITPHPTAGIGKWTKDMFVQRFKAYADSSASNQPIEPGAFKHHDALDLVCGNDGRRPGCHLRLPAFAQARRQCGRALYQVGFRPISQIATLVKSNAPGDKKPGALQ